MNHWKRVPDDLVQDEALAGYLTLQDKYNFQAGQVRSTKGLRCVPTTQRYSTIPRKKKECPPYTTFDENTKCCTADMHAFAQGSGGRFMQALAQSIGRTQHADFASTIFDTDIVQYLRNRRRVRFDVAPHEYDPYDITAPSTIAPLTIDMEETWFDVFMQFLFRAKPSFDVFVVTGYNQFNLPVTHHVFDRSVAKWKVSDGDANIANLMRKTGVDGCVVYLPPANRLLHHTETFHMKSSCLEHGGRGHIDITHVAKMFSSAKNGFNGRKELFFRARGIVSKPKTFDDVVVDVVRSMPAMSCKFQVCIDIGVDSVQAGGHVLDENYHRIPPVYVAFVPAHGPVLDINEWAEAMCDRLAEDLGIPHRPKPRAFYGRAVGSDYAEDLIPPSGAKGKDNYNLKLAVFMGRDSATGAESPTFSITKTML